MRPTILTRRRAGYIATIAVGAAVALILGGGLFALVTDGAFSSRNKAASGTYTPPPPPSHDVQIAQIAGSASCDSATYGESTGAGFSLDSAAPNVDLGSSSWIEQAVGSGSTRMPTTFCVKNFGTNSGDVSINFVDVIETDDVCSTNESGYDEDCGLYDSAPEPFQHAAELAQILQAEVRLVDASPAAACRVLPAINWDFYWDVNEQPLGSIAAGEWCRFQVALRVDPAADDGARWAAETDTVEWSIMFRLKDPQP